MLKVSFKENFRKVQVFNSRATVVTLTGEVLKPGFMDHVPKEIDDWMTFHPSVEVYEHYTDKGWMLQIKVKGKSLCSEGDSFDAILGERIAESRAKIKFYKFMRTLVSKIADYYLDLLAGKGSHGGFDSDGTGLVDIKNIYEFLLNKEDYHLCKLLEEV